MPTTIMRAVRPSPQWQDSLIRLRGGERVVFDVEGTWSPDMRNQIVWCGADGVHDLAAGDEYLMPGVNVGALVARIGDGRPIAVGSRHDFVAGAPGALLLAMNESPQRNCQAGQVMAQVVIFEP